MSLYSSLTQVLAPFAAKINGLLTGWDGTRYQTPGEAVRQQIADLHVLIGDEPGTAIAGSSVSYDGTNSALSATNVQDAIDETNEKFTAVNGRLQLQKSKFRNLDNGYASADDYGTFIIGGLSNGSFITKNNRIVSQDIIYIDHPITLYVSAPYRAYVALFDGEGVYQSSQGWLNSIKIETGMGFKISVSLWDGDTEVTTSVTDIEPFVGSITFTSKTKYEINNKVGIEDLGVELRNLDNGYANAGNYGTFIIGGLSNGSFITKNNRIVSQDIVYIDHPITLLIAEPYKAYVALFDGEGTYKKSQGWLNSIEIEQGAGFKVSVSKWNDGSEVATPITDIRPFVQSITFTSRTEYEINKIKRQLSFAPDGYANFVGVDLQHIQMSSSGVPGTIQRLYLATTPDFFSVPYNTVVMTAEPYVGIAYKYESDGTFIHYMSASNRMFVEGGKKYRFQFSITGSTDTIDISDVQKKVTYYTESRMQTPKSYAFDKLSPAVISANHRGYNHVAPENTLPAYRLSKSKGFAFGETDVQWTSDGIAVLLHDATINRTARNADGTQISETVALADITYAQALTYDFGIFMGEAYAGTRIPTFEEFINLCKNIDYCAVIQIGSSNATQAQCIALAEKVKELRMSTSVIWLCDNVGQAQWLIENDPYACVGLYSYSISEKTADALASCLTGYNRLWYDFAYGKGEGTYNWNSEDAFDICDRHEIMIGVYDANIVESILALSNRVKIVTSDFAVPFDVIYDANIGDPETGLLQ